jgi:hypothetical protein
MTAEQARGALDYWEGPLEGLRLARLAHWGTAWARGGAPYDAGLRERLARESNPYGVEVLP